MPAVEYRMFFDNDPADRERLDKFEEIVVEQEVDMMWEARLKMPVRADGAGHWEGEDEPFVQPFTRVRVEVCVGARPFVPLIDGLITEVVAPRDSQPGRSSVTLVVHDDGVLLDQEESVVLYEEMTDSDIARQLFGAALTGPPDVEDTPAQPDNPSNVVMQRGTPMQLLRRLARRHGMHAYVLPGESPGQSVGSFKTFTTEADPDLPMLVLLGDGRNLARLQPRRNARGPANVRGATVSIKDKRIITSSAAPSDATLMGDAPAVEGGANTPTRLLPPGQNDVVDLDRRTRGAASNLALASEATGSVLPFAYGGVLRPYRVVPVNVSDSNLSVNYLITQVRHTLNRSVYDQSFTLRSNAVSAAQGGAPSGPQASAAAVGFNTQGSIF
jgi:hypothetical protein